MRYDYEIFFQMKLRALASEPRVVDIGGGEPFQKGMARYRELFRNTRFETVDPDPGTNPTVVGDAHHLPFAASELPAILSKSVFEHLADPKRAADEMWRVLAPGGKALVYTHFIYPYHARRGAYEDYFRFTEAGLRVLFHKFSRVEFAKHGGYFRALSFFLPFQHRLQWLLEPMAYILDKLTLRDRGSTTAGYYVYLVK